MLGMTSLAAEDVENSSLDSKMDMNRELARLRIGRDRGSWSYVITVLGS